MSVSLCDSEFHKCDCLPGFTLCVWCVCVCFSLCGVCVCVCVCVCGWVGGWVVGWLGVIILCIYAGIPPVCRDGMFVCVCMYVCMYVES